MHELMVWLTVFLLFFAYLNFFFELSILSLVIFQIDAHRSPLAAMVLSSNGMYIATASEQGTIIRVHLVSEATKVKHHKCL